MRTTKMNPRRMMIEFLIISCLVELHGVSSKVKDLEMDNLEELRIVMYSNTQRNINFKDWTGQMNVIIIIIIQIRVVAFEGGHS
jgi:hypothetical protein